ncbi:MAG: sulfotransferase [Myxococcota bacterium]
MAEPHDATSPMGIVIIGTPRSGTTLLRRILDAHPNIASPPETYLLSAAARFLHQERFAPGLGIGVLSGLAFAGFSEDEVLGRLRRFVFDFLAEHAAAQGKARWAEKTAFDAFHLPAIERLCRGHVRFLCVQRHGLDVACSMADLVDKTGGYVQELHAYLRRTPEPLAALAHAWVDTSRAVHALAQADPLALELRYEDLVREPATVLRQVLAFIDEPEPEDLLDRALRDTGRLGFGDWKTYGRTAIDDSSVGRWKALPSPTVQRLAAICNDNLETLGYDPVPVDEGEVSDEQARRSYEFGLMLNRMKAKG